VELNIQSNLHSLFTKLHLKIRLYHYCLTTLPTTGCDANVLSHRIHLRVQEVQVTARRYTAAH
jgi:hypothetical protein